LSESEIDAVVAQVKQFSTAFNGASPQGIVVPPRPATTAASVERGRALYIAQDCVGCHGPDGRKGGFLVDSSTNHPTPIRDLTAPWTFRGGSDPNQIWLRLTTGVGNSMPSYASGLTPRQRWDLVSYVQSLARVAPLGEPIDIKAPWLMREEIEINPEVGPFDRLPTSPFERSLSGRRFRVSGVGRIGGRDKVGS
jgi:mono/diheme cytochrome c family protein